jgi:hypothetical protein
MAKQKRTAFNRSSVQNRAGDWPLITSLSISPLSDYAREEWHSVSEDVREFGSSILLHRAAGADAVDVSWRRS